MFEAEIILRLAGLAALGGYLVFKSRQRLLREFDYCQAAQATGKAIDATKLKQLLEEVRRDYRSALHTPKSNLFRRGLLASARQTMVRFAYFHDRILEEHAVTHAPQVKD